MKLKSFSARAGLAAWVCLAVSGAATAAPKPTPSPSASPSADAGLFPGGNSKDPINIEADRLDYSDRDAKAIYSGSVVLIQGPTKLTCSVMTLFLDKGSPSPTPSATPTPASMTASPPGANPKSSFVNAASPGSKPSPKASNFSPTPANPSPS